MRPTVYLPELGGCTQNPVNERNRGLSAVESIAGGLDYFRLADDPLGAVAKHCAVTRERS